MTCEPGQIVLIPFPYSDLRTSKRRPVLVLTAPDSHGDFIGLAITSVPGREHAVPIPRDSLSGAELPKPSWVRVDKVFTLETSHIWMVFGAVSKAFLADALSGLCLRVGHSS